jgi:type I restriction enzyme M protein
LEYRTAVNDYMRDEVLPYVPDAWVDHGRTKIGYEIPLTRHFYRYLPPRALDEIDAEIRTLEKEIQRLLAEVTT